MAPVALAGGSIEERLEAMERRILKLEEQVAAQNKAMAEKDRQIAELKSEKDQDVAELKEMASSVAGGSGDSWYNNIEISGLVELEASTTDPYEGGSESDAVLATVELAIAGQVHDWVGFETVLLHEEDDTDLEVDVGTVTVAPPDGHWSITAGQYYLPFGVFESNFISDSLTLELGETRETAVQLGFENVGMSAALYIFNGDVDDDGDDRLASYGGSLGYAHEGGAGDASLTVSYISNMLDSDSLQEGLPEEDYVPDHVHGISASAMANFGNFSLLGEYLGAQDEDLAMPVFGGVGNNGEEMDPVAGEAESWMLEAAYNFSWMGRDAVFAIGYQETDDAFFLGLPEQRLMAGLSVGIFDQVALAFEWAHDEDYDSCTVVSDGERVSSENCGTGKTGNTLTVQLAAEF